MESRYLTVQCETSCTQTRNLFVPFYVTLQTVLNYFLRRYCLRFYGNCSKRCYKRHVTCIFIILSNLNAVDRALTQGLCVCSDSEETQLPRSSRVFVLSEDLMLAADMLQCCKPKEMAYTQIGLSNVHGVHA